MHTQLVVVRDAGGVGRVAPGGHLLGAHSHRVRRLGLAGARLGRAAQVMGRHQIGEHVVTDHRRVLVGPGHPVDVPDAVPVVMPERVPQARGLDEDLQTAVRLQ